MRTTVFRWPEVLLLPFLAGLTAFSQEAFASEWRAISHQDAVREMRARFPFPSQPGRAEGGFFFKRRCSVSREPNGRNDPRHSLFGFQLGITVGDYPDHVSRNFYAGFHRPPEWMHSQSHEVSRSGPEVKFRSTLTDREGDRHTQSVTFVYADSSRAQLVALRVGSSRSASAGNGEFEVACELEHPYTPSRPVSHFEYSFGQTILTPFSYFHCSGPGWGVELGFFVMDREDEIYIASRIGHDRVMEQLKSRDFEPTAPRGLYSIDLRSESGCTWTLTSKAQLKNGKVIHPVTMGDPTGNRGSALFEISCSGRNAYERQLRCAPEGADSLSFMDMQRTLKDFPDAPRSILVNTESFD